MFWNVGAEPVGGRGLSKSTYIVTFAFDRKKCGVTNCPTVDETASVAKCCLRQGVLLEHAFYRIEVKALG